MVNVPCHSERKRSILKAFTLAEVLITLGIIGVVAAMILPTFIAKYQEKQIVTQLAKNYSILSQAWQMMQAEYGTIDTWGLDETNTGQTDPDTGNAIYNHSSQSLIAQRLKQYLNVAKTCQLNEVCDPRPEYYLSGKGGSQKILTATSDSPPEANFILNDGTSISLGWYVTNQYQLKYFPKGYLDILVTLPGSKTRIRGKNVFFFKAGDKGVLPEGDDRTANVANSYTLFKYCDPTDTSTNSGRGCAAWVINNKNLDYLHCREKLGWDKASSCKD